MDWNRVASCKHENTYPDYGIPLHCPCHSYEFHCKDCGAYFTNCRCGVEVGESGWPVMRWRHRAAKGGRGE